VEQTSCLDSLLNKLNLIKFPRCDNRFNYTLEQGIGYTRGTRLKLNYLRNACGRRLQIASCWQIKLRPTDTIVRSMKSNKQHQWIAQLNWVNEVARGLLFHWPLRVHWRRFTGVNHMPCFWTYVCIYVAHLAHRAECLICSLAWQRMRRFVELAGESFDQIRFWQKEKKMYYRPNWSVKSPEKINFKYALIFSHRRQRLKWSCMFSRLLAGLIKNKEIRLTQLASITSSDTYIQDLPGQVIVSSFQSTSVSLKSNGHAISNRSMKAFRVFHSSCFLAGRFHQPSVKRKFLWFRRLHFTWFSRLCA